MEAVLQLTLVLFQRKLHHLLMHFSHSLSEKPFIISLAAK